MLYTSLDTAFVITEGLDSAVAPYERLGLRLSPETELVSHGLRMRSLAVGDAGRRFTALFLAGAADVSPHPADEPFRRTLATRRGLSAVGLRVRDLDEAVGHFLTRGFEIIPQEVTAADGTELLEMAWLAAHERAGTDIVLVARPERADVCQPAPADGGGHTFPLRRLDHLAAITHDDLDEKTRFWTDVLGIPQAGEVKAGHMVIRQFRVGDVIMELLGPTAPDSPLLRRPAGLISMMAWEVPDLDSAVTQARAAGLPAPDPNTGVLPGTRTATIPANEMSGVAMQMLEYVG